MNERPQMNKQTAVRRKRAYERDQQLLQLARQPVPSASTIVARSEQPALVKRMNRGHTR